MSSSCTRSATLAAAVAICAVFAALAVAQPPQADAAVITCQAPAKRLVEVTSVRNTTCLAARVDIDGFGDAFAPSFRTPGGYECARVSRAARQTGWRCVLGTKAYRIDRYGATRPGVRVKSPGYDKTFVVTRCTNRGERDLVLRGSGLGGIKLAITAPSMRGTLGLSGGNEEDGILAKGAVTSVRVGDDASIRVAGRFTSGLTGAFTVTGDCI